jgi:cobalt-zinc-cadmium efflux system outer membrane protein
MLVSALQTKGTTVLRRLRFLRAIVLVSGVAAPLFAQEALPAARSAAQPLTLAAALDLAEKQNLDLIAARAQRAVAQAGIRVAGQRPNPTAFFGATRDTPHESLFFDQPLELGSKRSDRIQLARAQTDLADADIAAIDRQIRHNVRDAFFALAFARGATGQSSEALKLAQRLLDIAKARYEAGDIPELEETQANLEVARADADLQVAQQEEKVALSDLNALLNEARATVWDLGDPFASLPPQLALDDLLARAGASNAEIAHLNQEAKVQQAQTSLLKTERVPNLGIEFGVDFNSPGPGGYREGARGQISMELPLFNRNQGEIAQSLATQQALSAELTAARRSADAKVESSYLDLEARRVEVHLYHDKILPSSRQLEELSEESYRAGKANILTVLGAQRDVQQAEREYLASLVAVQSAFAQLEEAVGAPLE